MTDPTAAARERQPFERHDKLARHVERMAHLGVGSLAEWNDFLRDLNAALIAAEQRGREAAVPAWQPIEFVRKEARHDD